MSRFSDLTRQELVSRLDLLDPSSSTKQPELRSPKTIKSPKEPKPFHFHSHPTRHVALLLTYHGWPYSGLAYQGDSEASTSALPTVESELLRALKRSKLIDPEGGFDECGYSRCGRTDRGVSGAGQVLSLWLRSARKEGDGGGQLGEDWRPPSDPPAPKPPLANGTDDAEPPEPHISPRHEPKPRLTHLSPAIELPYPRILNALLPPSIRIIAWSPAPPTFDARFSCSFRHYKYAFHPSTLSLPLMRDAASRLIGHHDFRNFCKLDGSKQIISHRREVLKAYFEPEGPPEGNLCVFNLVGTAFLWHQVRHIIGVLFLVGSRLEAPQIIDELLDEERTPGKPNYRMGAALPLTLWECGYEEPLQWRYDGNEADDGAVGDGPQHGFEVLQKQLEEEVQEARLRLWQISNTLDTVRRTFPHRAVERGWTHRDHAESSTRKGQVSFPVGGGEVLSTTKYVPVMERRPLGPTPAQVNKRWREKKGIEEVGSVSGD